MAVGVIVGEHQVTGGDTERFEDGLWATSVTADNPDAAQQAAIAHMRTSR